MAEKKNTLPGAMELLDIKCEQEQTPKRQRKKREPELFRDTLARLLRMKVNPTSVCDSVKSTALGESLTFQEAMLIAQLIKATNGDTQAASFIRDTSGNKLKEVEPPRIHKKFEDFF
ncbi:MAG: hypothetical protein IJ004_05435 [Clostridia bacterium]|nr:hypothetical protein [Clostridia bacterium]